MIAAAAKSPKSAEAEKVGRIMNDAFKRLDADRSGFLEKHELEDVLKKITKGLGKEEPSNEDFDFIMKELDVNGDGKLSKDEFKELIEVVMQIISEENAPQEKSKKGASQNALAIVEPAQ